MGSASCKPWPSRCSRPVWPSAVRDSSGFDSSYQRLNRPSSIRLDQSWGGRIPCQTTKTSLRIKFLSAAPGKTPRPGCRGGALRCGPLAVGFGPESGRSRGLRRGKRTTGSVGLKELRKSVACRGASKPGHLEFSNPDFFRRTPWTPGHVGCLLRSNCAPEDQPLRGRNPFAVSAQPATDQTTNAPSGMPLPVSVQRAFHRLANHLASRLLRHFPGRFGEALSQTHSERLIQTPGCMRAAQTDPKPKPQILHLKARK